MQVGQKVLLIATWPEYDCVPPPIGAVGEITEPMDADGDYYVLFPEHPCPVDNEPEWFTPAWAIIPINDPDAPAAGNVSIAWHSIDPKQFRYETVDKAMKEAVYRAVRQVFSERLQIELPAEMPELL